MRTWSLRILSHALGCLLILACTLATAYVITQVLVVRDGEIRQWLDHPDWPAPIASLLSTTVMVSPGLFAGLALYRWPASLGWPRRVRFVHLVTSWAPLIVLCPWCIGFLGTINVLTNAQAILAFVTLIVVLGFPASTIAQRRTARAAEQRMIERFG